MSEKIKKAQKINNEIPIETWESFEDLFIIEKRKYPDRNLKKKDFFIQVFTRGVDSWLT